MVVAIHVGDTDLSLISKRFNRIRTDGSCGVQADGHPDDQQGQEVAGQEQHPPPDKSPLYYAARGTAYPNPANQNSLSESTHFVFRLKICIRQQKFIRTYRD